MKIFSKYAWALLVVMMIGFISCGDDSDELKFSPEELAYIQKNREYIRTKKDETNEKGELKYNQIVLNRDTILYCIVHKENNYTAVPGPNSVVQLHNLEGKLIDGKAFQKKIAASSFPMNQLIPGMTAVLARMHADETVEAIIPASLGYGYVQMHEIPAGSTLIFTFTLYNF